MENKPNSGFSTTLPTLSSRVLLHKACSVTLLYVYSERVVYMEVEGKGPFIHIYVTQAK